MKEKHKNKVFWAILATEFSHIFCCVLPTLFSVVSLMAGFGLVASIPTWLVGFHSAMHGWEIPMLTFSMIVVLLGWTFHFYSYKEDCHDHGCHHAPCGPRKRRANKILVVATVLLFVNAAVYFGLHRGMDVGPHEMHNAESGEHHDHDEAAH